MVSSLFISYSPVECHLESHYSHVPGRRCIPRLRKWRTLRRTFCFLWSNGVVLARSEWLLMGWRVDDGEIYIGPPFDGQCLARCCAAPSSAVPVDHHRRQRHTSYHRQRCDEQINQFAVWFPLRRRYVYSAACRWIVSGLFTRFSPLDLIFVARFDKHFFES